MKTITLANHKGGCAKTTTALNLSVALASKGARVLAVDLELQGNLSAALGADLGELEDTRKTTHRLLLDPGADYSEYIISARPRRLCAEGNSGCSSTARRKSRTASS
jgi:cellulose biosynthesis protein BcsQ